jgi:lysophospholipase L1-like esterase
MLYGANSVGDDWYSIEQYEQWVIDAMTRVRRAIPDASCLWVGPPDMARPTLAYDGPAGTPPAIHQIIAAQRDAAELVGCGYYSSYEAMGGEDSNLRWAEQEPSLVSGDGIHFTAPGYRLLGDMLYEALIDGYERYIETNPES